MPPGKPLRVETEEEFQRTVLDLARLLGWLCYHTQNSRGSAAGFPDLCMVRRGRVVFAELKAEGGRMSSEQDRWLAELLATPAEVYAWRPSSWPQIERVLMSDSRPEPE